MDANIGIICFKSKVLANGEHPLMLRISQGKLRYFKSLGISIKKNSNIRPAATLVVQ